MEQVKIEYLGHSCFRMSWNGQRIVLDPYADGCVSGCPALRVEAEFVYCSHSHGDHGAVETVTLCSGGAPKFGVTELETDHDDVGGAKRGKNTVRIFDFGGIRVAHFGDLGRSLTAAETNALRGLDCALMPVGGFFTIDAAAAAAIASELQPKKLIPMHFRSDAAGFDVLAHIDDVLPVLERSGVPVCIMARGDSLVLEK